MTDARFSVTILGASPAAQNPGGHCSGYLLREGGRAVLVDCGSGVVGQLRRYLRAAELQAVVISHLHADHYFDLVPLYYSLMFGPREPGEAGKRVPVHLPPGGVERLRQLSTITSSHSQGYGEMLDLQEYTPNGLPVDIGGLSYSFHPVQHYIPSYAMRIRGANGRLLVFSSDVAPCQAIVDAAREADLFLCESAVADPDQVESDPSQRGHMTAAEAGQTARLASAARLLVTHYQSSPELDARQLAAAQAAFGGPVELAKEGQQYAV